MRSCRELDNSRSGLSAASAFAIATSGANEGAPNKEKYRRMSLASAGAGPGSLTGRGPFLPPPRPRGQLCTESPGGARWAGTALSARPRGRRGGEGEAGSASP